ncbi:uncharacterized protein LOC128331395 [Hemicordylus capensis]|uniref:uncharacterized protein LOC128331395 n=1 Tax=Hemicordylus capensis TaxID=884348 RepID=UPI0023042A6D|nr:uncharacterized protein LOC128331395 [Hemicordylus capensis]
MSDTLMTGILRCCCRPLSCGESGQLALVAPGLCPLGIGSGSPLLSWLPGNWAVVLRGARWGTSSSSSSHKLRWPAPKALWEGQAGGGRAARRGALQGPGGREPEEAFSCAGGESGGRPPPRDPEAGSGSGGSWAGQGRVGPPLETGGAGEAKYIRGSALGDPRGEWRGGAGALLSLVHPAVPWGCGLHKQRRVPACARRWRGRREAAPPLLPCLPASLSPSGGGSSPALTREEERGRLRDAGLGAAAVAAAAAAGGAAGLERASRARRRRRRDRRAADCKRALGSGEPAMQRSEAAVRAASPAPARL